MRDGPHPMLIATMLPRGTESDEGSFLSKTRTPSVVLVDLTGVSRPGTRVSRAVPTAIPRGGKLVRRPGRRGQTGTSSIHGMLFALNIRVDPIRRARSSCSLLLRKGRLGLKDARDPSTPSQQPAHHGAPDPSRRPTATCPPAGPPLGSHCPPLAVRRLIAGWRAVSIKRARRSASVAHRDAEMTPWEFFSLLVGADIQPTSVLTVLPGSRGYLLNGSDLRGESPRPFSLPDDEGPGSKEPI